MLVNAFLKSTDKTEFDSTSETECAEKADPFIVDRESAADWSNFPGSESLQAWGRQLNAAITATEADSVDWILIGRAVVIQCDDESHCRNVVRRIAADAKMRLLVVADEGVENLEFSDLMRSGLPALVYLEPGRWLRQPKDDDDVDFSLACASTRESVMSIVDAFEDTQPIVLVTSATSLANVAEPLRHAGVFDRYFGLPKPSPELVGDGFLDLIGRKYCSQALESESTNVGHLVRAKYETDRRRELAALRLSRLAANRQRKLEFVDLIEVATRGFVESGASSTQSAEARRRVAIHEAGHAAAAIVVSGGRHVPDYVSIIPCAAFQGVVVESYQFNAALGDDLTYDNFQQRVRLSLGGRAAEHLVLGVGNISTGASSDLEDASRLARIAFSRWGFAPSMNTDDGAAANLGVASIDDEDLSASDTARLETMVTKFLREEYLEVLRALSTHRAFLDAIVERLLRDAMLDHRTLSAIATEYLD